MVKRLFLGVLAAVLLTGLVTVAPAHADERPCVSWQEYYNIKNSWPPPTKTKVSDHFDLWGYKQRSWTGPGERWAYKKCAEWGPGYVDVLYRRNWDGYRLRVNAIAPSLRAPWYYLY